MTVLNLVRVGLSLLFAVSSCIASNNNCMAQQPNIAGRVIQSSTLTVSSIPPLVPQRAIKSIPKTVEVYQYDNSPLGNRQPLLLIHGLLGESHPLFRWQQLAEYLSQDQEFQNRFKIYLARYNSKSSLKEITEGFNHAFRELAPTGGLSIVAISLSGAIVRDAMRDPAVDKSISRVLTLGSFFRGSPLFCADWMQQSIRKRHLSPLYRIERSLGYKVYFAHHQNLLRDFAWDNVDGQMPILSPKFARAHPDLATSSGEKVKLSDAEQQPSDRKFIVYAGYLRNQYFPHSQGALHTFLISPLTFCRTTLPGFFGRERPALRLLNYLIADAIPRKSGSANIIYPLNDGISPISSSLLLSNDFVAHSCFSNQEFIDNIRTHSNAMKPRLFENTDHLTFIEGPKPIGSAGDVTDVLSIGEKPRPMFAWILNDLLELNICQSINTSK